MYDELRHAIVAKACQDYDWAIRYLMRPPEKRKRAQEDNALWIKADCEWFFRSEWFTLLCDLDGQKLAEHVRKYGYFGNAAKPDKDRDNWCGRTKKWKQQGEKKRRQRMKEFEEYEKRQSES